MAHFGKDLEDFNGSRCIQIRSAEQTENFTVYVVSVTVGSYTWTVKHRYSEFFELHEKLTACYKLDKGLLPPKKLFGNQTESFVKKRQRELEIYLQTILLYLAQHIPSCLAYFLDFDNYEIHGITQAMAEDLYNRGENLLQSREKYPVTSLQLYSLTERLKLPEPTCDSGDVKKDLGHILDFITRTKHLKVTGGTSPVGTSNIIMSKLPFDLTLFKSLQTLEITGCNFHLIGGLETIKQTLMQLQVHESSSSMKDMFLQDSPHWKAEDGSVLVGNWDLVTLLDLSNNSLALIHPSIQLMPNVETLNLSYNEIEAIQNLHWLSQLTHVNLSNNHIHHIDSLHTKLGNVKVFVLAHNQLESLHGFSKLFSLQTLDVSHNKISLIEEIQHISQLPCLENILMEGNSVTSTLDYRTKTLELFGDRVAEVTLDRDKPNQKELDTVAVLQALSKAKNTKVPKKAMSRRNASAASLTEGYYGQTPPGSLSDQLDGGQMSSQVSGPMSHSVPTAIPWARKESLSSALSRSPFSQDSESSYNSAVDADVGLDKVPETLQPFHHPVSSSTTFPSDSTYIKMPSTQSTSNNNSNNSNNVHELVPEAHPFDLSFENLAESSTSTVQQQVKVGLPNPSLHTTGTATGFRKKELTKPSLENVSLGKDSGSSKEKAVDMKESSDCESSSSSTGQGVQDTTTDLPQKRNWISTYNAADLPSSSNKSFVCWLHNQLLTSDDFEQVSPSSEASTSSILDIMWCYAQQMSHPDIFLPCCVILTPTTIFLEKLVGTESGFQGVPHLQPLYILSVKNIQQLIIGPCYCYLRFEESFVGKSGTFSLFGLEPQGVRRMVNAIISQSRKLSLTNELDCIDLSMQSELLKEIISYEEKMPCVASDRLVLMMPIRMLGSATFNFLILSENRVYCVGLNCSHWPPPSFQSSPEDKFCLDILHEFSILNKIVDLKIHLSSDQDHSSHQTFSSDINDLSVAFTMYQLSINVSVSQTDWIANVTDPQQSKKVCCYNYLFPSSAYRDLFLDRLSNLRAEHENRMYPNVREEPEGGNDQVPPAKCQNQNYISHVNEKQVMTASVSICCTTKQLSSSKQNTGDALTESDSQDAFIFPKHTTEIDSVAASPSHSIAASPSHSESNDSFRSVLTESDIYKEAIEYQGPGNCGMYSSSPKDDALSVSPMSNFSRASISPPPDLQKVKSVKDVETPRPPQLDTWQYDQTSPKADSLPSSFDWKKFYFKSPLNQIDIDSQGLSAAGVTHVNPVKSDSSDNGKSFGNRLFLDLKNAITTSGEGLVPLGKVNNETKPVEPIVVESEHDMYLKQCIKSYNLFHTLPTKLKPLCLMNGSELRKFFYTTIAQYSNLEGLHEELHFVLWSSVIPYTNPRQEIVTLVMLSTYAVYLVSDTEVKVAKTSRPSWMSHSRNQSDSAITWKTEGPNSPGKKHVKSYAAIRYKDLHQVNVGLFDQCIRLTGSNENSIFTIATRDRQLTEKLIQKLKHVLSLSVSSPMIDNHDLEQDFYRAKSHTSKSTSESLVYTHPSKVSFIYPGDETVRDMLYLIKQKIASKTAAATTLPQNNPSSSLWFYIQCYHLSSDDTVSLNINNVTNQIRSVIITPLYFALAEEDVVTYPLPDFVRGLPENPCHEILECRHIDSLKSVQLYQSNPHWVCLKFADEKLGIVVDVSMQHFGQPQVAKERQKPGPEICFKLFVQSLVERDKLVHVLEKLWKQQVSVVGRILDVHTV